MPKIPKLDLSWIPILDTYPGAIRGNPKELNERVLKRASCKNSYTQPPEADGQGTVGTKGTKGTQGTKGTKGTQGTKGTLEALVKKFSIQKSTPGPCKFLNGIRGPGVHFDVC